MTRERWKINVRGKERDLGNVLINEEEELKEKGRERERERKKKSNETKGKNKKRDWYNGNEAIRG